MASVSASSQLSGPAPRIGVEVSKSTFLRPSVVAIPAAPRRRQNLRPATAVRAQAFPYGGDMAALQSGLRVPKTKPLQAESSVVQPRAQQRKKPPPVMPYIYSPAGPTDLMSAFLRNRIVFVGSTINAQTAQKVISQLISLATINEDEDIKMYINCPGGSTYSVLAIYDCMAWIKPDVSTVGFGMCASQGAFLLSAGAKGKRMAMPNTRIMIHQPQGGCGGTSEDVRRQVNEVMQSRDKLDKMFSAFTGQPVETIQKFTERDRFFSPAEAAEFGLIDGVLETEY